MIKWLFFDLGSTLVNEEAAYRHRILDMIQGSSLSFEEVDARRKELAREGFDGNTAVISFFGLQKTPWHTEDETLYEDAAPVLRRMKERGYNLGILANQVSGTAERLEHWGIRAYFDVIASSDQLGVAKPDRAIFETAIRMAGCAASEAVMIGDRLDNDIIPAKAYGMQTIWIRRGLAACQPKELGSGCADWIIDQLRELEEILDRAELEGWNP